LAEKGRIEKVLKERELQYCDMPLKIIHNKGETYCLGCFIDKMESGGIYTDKMISSMTYLTKARIVDFLKELRGKNLLRGVIDPLKVWYISLSAADEERMIKRINQGPVDIDKLAKNAGLENRVMRLIISNLLENIPEIKGRFTDLNIFIKDELIMEEISKLIKQGPVLIPELAIRYQLKNEEIKEIIDKGIEDGIIHGFYEKSGQTVIEGENLQTRIRVLLDNEGRINLKQRAIEFMIGEEVLRDKLKDLINKDKIEGFYTGDGSFEILKSFERKLYGLFEIYKKIPLQDLSTRLNISLPLVEKLLTRMIREKKVVGSIVNNVFEQSKISGTTKKRAQTLKFLDMKVKDANNLQYILIFHRDSGACLFDYSCSELKFNSDLITGFLQAISSFGSEIDAKGASILEEIKWRGFVIAISEGNYVKTAFICKDSPSTSLKSNIKYFLVNFEKQFHYELINWTGNYQSFKKTVDLVEKFFKVGYKLLFFIPRIPRSTISQEEISQKIQVLLENKGNVELLQLEQIFGMHFFDLMDILELLVINKTGRFTRDLKNFVSEVQIINNIASILLNVKEISISELSIKLNIESRDIEEIILNLINEERLNAHLDNDILRLL
jgi:hypothetical protein